MVDKPLVRPRVIEQGEEEQVQAGVYARTSSQNQKYGYSLEEQVNQSVDRCQSLGWEVRYIYRDEAESGKDTDREMFQTMLEAAKNGAFDVIVFWKLDRFSRSLMHAVQLEADLRDHDVGLYSVTEQIDTTSATGRFNFRNIASAAEFERDMIKQRTTMALNGLAEDYRWPNDTPPLGYETRSDGKLTIVDQEAELVIEIFELYIEKRSMPEVAGILNERGIETQEGGEWTARAVGDILRNEIYTGQYEVGNVSEHVQEYQIIDEEQFREVKSIRHRFQQKEASRESMPSSRKEEVIKRLYERYCEYLDASS